MYMYLVKRPTLQLEFHNVRGNWYSDVNIFKGTTYVCANPNGLDTKQTILRETEVLQGKLATTRQALQRQTAKNKYLKKKGSVR